MKIPYKRSLIVALAFCLSDVPALPFSSSQVAGQTFSGPGSRLPQPSIGPQTANSLPPIVTRNPAQLPPIVSGSTNRQNNDWSNQESFVPPVVNGVERRGQTNGMGSGALRPLQPQTSAPNQGYQANNREDVPMLLPTGPNAARNQRSVSSSGVPFYRPQDPEQGVIIDQPAIPDKTIQQQPAAQPTTNRAIQPAPRSVQPTTPAATLNQDIQQPQAAQKSPAPRATAPRSSVPPQSMETVLDSGMPQQQGTTLPMNSRNPAPSDMKGPQMLNRAPATIVGEGVVVAPEVEGAMIQRSPDASGAPLPSYFDGNPQSNMTPGCMDCVANGGAANCPTCNQNGYGGGYGNGNGNGSRNSQGYFGAMSQARRYVELDALYMTRTDGTIVFSNFGGLGSYDWNLGWRATLGTRYDETQGRELSYFGTAGIEKDITRTSAAGQLSALFTPSALFAGALTDPFFDANLQNESMETQLHSVEFNRVTWAWDVVKTFVGFRYIHIDDSYSLTSQKGADIGQYRLESFNNLIGVHIGRELFYDVGYRMSLSGLGKAGVYANANRFEANATSNGTRFVDNTNDSSTISTTLELNLTGHYQINRRSRFRMGYQAMLLDDIFSVSDNITGGLSPFTGAGKPSKDSMFIHGLNFGIEIYR